jgi:signal transduction histidine kinase
MIVSAGTAPSRGTAARVVVQLLCLLVFLTAGLAPNGFFETTSNAIFDAYQRFVPARRQQSQVVLVDVDDESLAHVGQWPWRRDRLARLITAVAGARVVGLDILLTEPDRLSPEALLSDWPDLAADAKEAVAELPRPDAVLATSMAGVKLVLAAAARSGGYDRPLNPVAATPIFETGSDPRPTLPRYRSMAWPLPAFVAASRGVGLVSALSEPDGITRRIPMVFAVGPALMPGFAAEVVRVATNVDRIGVRVGPAGDRELEIGDRRIGIDAAGRAWPQFGRHLAAESVSAYRVLEGTVDLSLFRDRIVLIGVGAAGLGDVTITPLHEAEPTLAIQAQLVDSMLDGDVLWRPPVAKAAEALLALALGAAALLLLGGIPDRAYGVLFAAATIALIAGSIVAFRTAGLLLDWTYPLATLVATTLVALVFRIRDEVHARRRHEQELALALMKAEAADRTKTEFLANANHELRTPLTAILGFSEVMSKQLLGPLSQKYAEYAHDIHQTAQHLHVIISDILDLAVIDLGGKEPAEDTVDVATVIAECARMTPVSRGGNVRIRTELAPSLPVLRADARMVKQMLINLLSNAIKYSPPGADVVIRAGICADGGLAITVRDVGAGIAAADIAYAMEPFGRLRSSALAQEPGIGIGLPLTKSMVELHGGRLTLKSEVGVGTEVRLWFPPSRIAATPEAS